MTDEQKQKRLDIATLLKERFNFEDQTFLREIVAVDDTWIRDFLAGLEITTQRVERFEFPSVKKILTSSIKVKEIKIFA